MTDSFSFKQFVVEQSLCGMKVGTDGVLLGAWANGGKRILDIGTGSGLIALMMAQRFVEAEVKGIDIEPEACIQACQNVENSPFSNRITVQHISVQQFAQYHATSLYYDAIVSNPPFFVRSLKSKGDKRVLARHTDSLNFSDLFRSVHSLLSPMGEFSAIVPVESLEEFESESYIQGLFMVRKCMVRTVDTKTAKRCLIAFRKESTGRVEVDEQCLITKEGTKTEWYRGLTDGFYLK